MEHKRLQELKRQKDLLLEHLDWINQEIDRETLEHAPSTSPKASRLFEAIDGDKVVEVDLSFEQAENEKTSQEQIVSELYDELGPNTKNAAADTKRGCMIVGGLAFLALGTLIAYLLYYY